MKAKTIDIVGPVIPIPTPFKENGDVDYQALAKYCEFLVDSGARNIMTTVGTSRFNLMSVDEIRQVNETVVKTAKGRAKTIVANPSYGSMKQSIEFGKHAAEIGADIFLLIHPDRHYGDDAVFSFFQNVCQATNTNVFIHEMPLRNGLGGGTVQYSVPLLERLFEIDNVVGLKEESLDPGHSRKILRAFGNKVNFVGAGGGMSRYLVDYWYGPKSFLAGIGNFNPQLELDFFEKLTEKDHKGAYEIVYNREDPYFVATVPMGWHPSLKEALDIKSLLPAHERAPMQRISAQHRTDLKKVIAQLEL